MEQNNSQGDPSESQSELPTPNGDAKDTRTSQDFRTHGSWEEKADTRGDEESESDNDDHEDHEHNDPRDLTEEEAFLDAPARFPLHEYKSLKRTLEDRTGNYKYIRLLTLKPGKGFDPIQCKLRRHRLGKKTPEFTAISYHWNEHAPGRAFIELPNRCTQVPRNLKLALKHLRSEDTELRFWCDAICIAQITPKESEEVQEKEEQLRLMQEIFQRATRVVVWLGREEHHSIEAMKLCNLIVDNEAKVYNKYYFQQDISPTEVYRGVLEEMNARELEPSTIDDGEQYVYHRKRSIVRASLRRMVSSGRCIRSRFAREIYS